jgi:hypothetical protein
MVPAVEPVLHVYEVAPEAVSVVLSPKHTLAEPGVATGVGVGVTSMRIVVVSEHPCAFAPITVYVVGTPGDTTTESRLEPASQV